MAVEKFNDLIRKKYLQSTDPTPFQIERQLIKQRFLTNLSVETGIENINVLEKAFYPNGKANNFKIDNFKLSLQEFRQKYTLSSEMLELLDAKCFRVNGTIIESRIRKIYKNII